MCNWPSFFHFDRWTNYFTYTPNVTNIVNDHQRLRPEKSEVTQLYGSSKTHVAHQLEARIFPGRKIERNYQMVFRKREFVTIQSPII